MLRLSHRQRGMSIVEVLVSITVVGILMTVAAPAATTWIQNTQLRNAAESIYNGVQTARLEALKRNTTVSFELTDVNSTAWRICLYDNVNNACQAAPPMLHEKSASEGSPNARVGAETVLTSVATAIDPGTAIPNSVTFDALGRLAPTAPTNMVRIDVRNPVMTATEERRLVILVTVGGQARMCDPKLTLATNPMGCV